MAAKAKTCKSKIVKGKRAGEVCGKTVYGDTTKCWGHQPKEAKALKGFGGAIEGSGRKKIESPLELARELVRQHAHILIEPHFKALGYDIEIKLDKETGDYSLELKKRKGGGLKLHGESKEGVIKVSKFEDVAAQIASAEKILDRLFGRPKQALEMGGGLKIEGVDTAPITNADRKATVESVLAAARANVN